MKKNLAKKITLSILAGAMLMSSSVVWAGSNIENTASGDGAIAISGGSGSSTTTTGKEAVAIGNDVNATGNQAVAIGQEAKATKDRAVAIGLQATANGFNAVAIGLQATANGGSSVAIGDGAIATANGSSSVAIGNGAIADAYNVVSVGDGGAVDGEGKPLDGADYRRIINVANGVNDNDAVTVAQLKEKADNATTLAGYGITDAYTKTEIDGMLGGSNNAAIDGINQRLDKTNAKINKVGAGAAALAALHPLEYDPDDKLTFSAGMGHYAGENAAALGAFYRPNEKFMVSLGGTMGNGENMVNLGLSIGLDKPNGYAKLSKRELIQKVNAMEAKYEAVEAENEAMKDQLANADERIAKLEALVAQLVKR